MQISLRSAEVIYGKTYNYLDTLKRRGYKPRQRRWGPFGVYNLLKCLLIYRIHHIIKFTITCTAEVGEVFLIGCFPKETSPAKRKCGEGVGIARVRLGNRTYHTWLSVVSCQTASGFGDPSYIVVSKRREHGETPKRKHSILQGGSDIY